MTSKIPAVHMLFQWAEREGDTTTEARLNEAIGDGLTAWDNHGNSADHTMALTRAILGFLSNCISGEVGTIFKHAGVFQ